MAAAEEAKAESKPAGKKLDLGKFMVLIFAVINLAIIGAFAFLVFQNTIGFKRPEIREEQALEKLQKERAESNKDGYAVTYAMPAFSVNLSGNPKRVMKVEMTLAMMDEEGYDEVVKLGPGARDAVVGLLSRMEFRDVESIQGKLRLKNEIISLLNKRLKISVITDVYFNDFLVQTP